jgi:hypothetical protein
MKRVSGRAQRLEMLKGIDVLAEPCVKQLTLLDGEVVIRRQLVAELLEGFDAEPESIYFGRKGNELGGRVDEGLDEGVGFLTGLDRKAEQLRSRSRRAEALHCALTKILQRFKIRRPCDRWVRGSSESDDVYVKMTKYRVGWVLCVGEKGGERDFADSHCCGPCP